MQHFHSLAELELNQAWATIGTFDGVHLGHQAILVPMAEAAHAAGCPAVVVTFYPNPVQVLKGIDTPMNLTSPEERAALMGRLGIDIVVTLTFDRALASLTAEEFMQQMSARLGLRELWVGSDFALGRNRQGDVPTLQAIGEKMGYRVHVTPDLVITNGNIRPEESSDAASSGPGKRISSSLIRELVRQGDMAKAARLLGRPYAMSGPVVHGEERGRLLGFPTANVAYWPGKIAPAYGVYATWTWVDGQRLPSVTSVGLRPTFNPPISAPRVEAYLIDYQGNLYDREARVEFLEFLRPELKFNVVQELIDQMVLDTEKAKEVLTRAA